MTDNTYRLPIEETLKSSWQKVSGSKGIIWIAFAIVFLLTIGINIVGGIFSIFTPKAAFVINLLGSIATSLLTIGITYIGIKRAQDLPISYNLMLKVLEGATIWRVVGTYFLTIIIIAIPIGIGFGLTTLAAMANSQLLPSLLMILFGLAAIYVSVRVGLGMAFVLDKDMNPWEAIKSSFRVTQGNFWRIIAIYIILELIVIISALPLGIGLIWTIPYSLIMYGSVYKNLSVNHPRS